MAVFQVGIEIGDPQGREYTSVEALVDTGSSYNALPASFLRRLGVSPHEQRMFELADGRRVERDVGRTWVRIDGRTEVVLVVFADEGARPLLGAVTLETFGLEVDPVGRRLIPVPGLLMAEREAGDIGAVIDPREYVRLIEAVQHSPMGYLWSSYDVEGDVLYVNFKKPSRATDSEITDDDIIIRYEDEEVIGITMLHASKRAGKTGSG